MVSVETTYLEADSSPGKFALFMGLSSDHRESGTGNSSTAKPALDDYEYAWRIDRGQGAGCRWEEPFLKPGESYAYTSGAPLNTPSGMMGGSYQMESERGERFDIEIPTFSLDCPNQDVFLN